MRVEPQVCFAVRLILAMAAQAVVGKQRQHFPAETYRLLCREEKWQTGQKKNVTWAEHAETSSLKNACFHERCRHWLWTIRASAAETGLIIPDPLLTADADRTAMGIKPFDFGKGLDDVFRFGAAFTA